MRVPEDQAAEERRLLGLGLTVKDVAATVGTDARRLDERNRLIYRIDLRAAFQSRIEREGIPTRLSIDSSFGHWFAGLFDGEGHFVIDLRRPRPRGNRELVLGLNVYLRDDDASVLEHIQSRLGGHFRINAKSNVAYWGLRGLRDLAEIAVPMFERHPLRSKKADEFELFRHLVLQRYAATLGGRRKRVPLQDIEEIASAIWDVRVRRHYAERSSWRVLEEALTPSSETAVR